MSDQAAYALVIFSLLWPPTLDIVSRYWRRNHHQVIT